MKYAADLKIELNGKDIGGNTAFHWACIWGQSEIVEILMKHSIDLNIDLNAKDNDGNTAFHVACYWGKTSIVEMMINNSESFKHTVEEFF